MATAPGAEALRTGAGPVTRRPTVLIAPDKFKGSLTAPQVACAVAEGLRRRRPEIRTVELPVADGGDGTLDVFLAAGYTRRSITVTGPDGDQRPSAIAIRDGTAVIESALTSGLTMRGGRPPTPLTAASRGVGDAIREALDTGARRIIIGLGGSACTDGGAGMLQSLGVRLLNSAGESLPSGAIHLLALEMVDSSGLDPRVREAEFILATDVVNPLYGPQGAAAVYGPQKGADPAAVEVLDRALRRLAVLTVPEAASRPGAGAAGGIGFGAMALLGARARPGIELVLDMVDFDTQLIEADLVITGEGRLDGQSLQGKVPMGVLTAAARRGVPTIAVCGSSELPAGPRQPDFDAVYALTDIAPDTSTAMRHAGALLTRLAARIPLTKP